MDPRFDELKRQLLEINDLSSAAALLRWDQTTYMPPGGADARGRQLALLSRLAHERLTDPAMGRLLERLEREAGDLAYDSDDAALLRVTRREYDQAVRVPARVRRGDQPARRGHATRRGPRRGRRTTSRGCGRCSRRRST